MRRIAEPELMDGLDQAQAYALADFREPNTLFLQLFKDHFPAFSRGHVLDLGCGPADICIMFAQAYPDCHVLGVDGSGPMLEHAGNNISRCRLTKNISLVQGIIPECRLPVKSWAAIISNSLLHHLPDPMVLWETIKSHAATGTTVLIMDLLRPPSKDAAQHIVTQYAADEPEILQKDFYHSLLAAYRLDEVEAQLRKAGLSFLQVRQASDRHLAVIGVCP